MAERRMFAKSIIDSDAFLTMPTSTQSLYFHLCMRADDDGFVNSPRSIQRMIGASDDDFKILLAKRFILPFDTGIIVIKHWRIHNYIQSDRYVETKYLDEKSMLGIKENKSYTFLSDNDDCIPLTEIKKIQQSKSPTKETKCIQNGNAVDTQDSLGKVSLDEDSKGKNSLDCDSFAKELDSIDELNKKQTRHKFTGKNIPPPIEEVIEYSKQKGYDYDVEEFYNHYMANGWMVGRVKMQDWRYAISNWLKNEKNNVYGKKNNQNNNTNNHKNPFAEMAMRGGNE